MTIDTWPIDCIRIISIPKNLGSSYLFRIYLDHNHDFLTDSINKEIFVSEVKKIFPDIRYEYGNFWFKNKNDLTLFKLKFIC